MVLVFHGRSSLGAVTTEQHRITLGLAAFNTVAAAVGSVLGDLLDRLDLNPENAQAVARTVAYAMRCGIQAGAKEIAGQAGIELNIEDPGGPA